MYKLIFEIYKDIERFSVMFFTLHDYLYQKILRYSWVTKRQMITKRILIKILSLLDTNIFSRETFYLSCFNTFAIFSFIDELI